MTSVSIDSFVRSLDKGTRIFLPGSAAESAPLTDELCAADAPPLDITASFVPGINPMPIDLLLQGSALTCIFAHPGTSAAQALGTFRHLPLSYSGFARHIADTLTFDICVVHVAPPNRDGRCSLGAAVEFAPIATAKSKRIVAIVNPRMPSMPGAQSLALDDIDTVIECDWPLREYHAGTISDEAQRIADNVATFVEDGATLQIGLGKTPDALLRALTNRRRLRIYSGMTSDGVMALEAAGALDPGWMHTGCVHVGSADYYKWLNGRPDMATLDCSRTHAAGILAATPNLIAVNAALTVDLFGQANLETLDGRMISGVGGAPDFARGASQSQGGISIVALPSTSRKGEVSRIVPSLTGLCSITRSDIDVIVTEHGAADIRGCSVMERGRQLIMAAAPQHRAMLDEAFHSFSKRF